jgi:hypothetical protein
MVNCRKNSGGGLRRYDCFKKGVGVGLRMTHRPHIYCGIKNIKPKEYNIGTRYECLRCVISKGRKKNVQKKVEKVKVTDVNELIELVSDVKISKSFF